MRNNLWIGSGISMMGEIPILGNPEKGLAKIMRGLFANSEKGFWYDPSDMGMVYQDAAGTTPVAAAGQPAGLILDKSKGLALGPEIIINGNFSGSSNWFVTNVDDTHFVDFTAGGARFYSASNTPIMQLRPSATLVPGKWYRIEVTTTGNVVGAIKSDGFIPGNLVLSGTQAGTHVTYAQARGTALFILRNSAVVDLTIKSVSVKEISGNHTYQNTSAARPILQQTPILGSELVVNGDFAKNDFTGWSYPDTAPSATTVANQQVTMTAAAGSALARLRQAVSVSAGEYVVSLNVVSITGTPQATLALGSNPNGSSTYGEISLNRVGKFDKKITVTTGTLGLAFTAGHPNGGSVVLDDISIKRVTGYRTDQNYIEYDGVDDKLLTDLATPLTNVTVLRAIPNVGTQVKYNQTLPVLYEDSTNHSGLIAINRALTRTEQLKLMTELDKKAGATSLETLTFKAFDNNQVGFVYDPNDLTTLYVDSIGLTPVTGIGQPVGLILDKSNGLALGPEKVTNGNFAAGTQGWVLTGNTTVSTAGARLTGLSTDASIAQMLNLEVGKTYKISASITEVSGSLAITVPTASRFTGNVIFTATSAQTNLYFRCFGSTIPADVTLSNISVRELKGNHAYQTTSASRPILRKNAVTGANYLEFDGVDDHLALSPISLPIPFSHVMALEDKKLDGTQALFSGVASGYLLITGGSNLGVQQNAGNPTMYMLRGKKEVITHISNSAGVTLKSNLSAATRNDLAHANPYTGAIKKYIGSFNDTQFSTVSRIDYYGSVFIKETINSAAEEEIRAHFNKRIGI